MENTGNNMENKGNNMSGNAASIQMSGKIHIWIYSVLIIAFIAAFVWGFISNKRASALEITVENQYNRAFHEMTDYIDSIDTQLAKAQLAHSPAQLASVSNDIFRQAAEAKSCLGQLPTSEIQLENTAKFLSQVGDYTYVLSQNMINGTQITDEQYKTLASLNEYASNLKNSLTDIQSDIYSGEVSFTGTDDGAGTVHAAGNNILADMENVEKAFDDYPSLIYDGPFSEHIENQESVMLKDAPEITQEEALGKARSFLGVRGGDLEFSNETSNTAIDAYTFTKNTDNGRIAVSVTKKGGYILYYLDSASVDDERVDMETATQNARKFLEERGYTNMEDSYYEKTNGIATINFAYSQNGIVCYSDLIKVRVALDTGDIVGMESKGYLMNHRERELNTPLITREQAREYVSPNLDVSAARLAVIPKDSLKEVLCYEFKGAFNGRNFIVYINAENGREEEILLLLESENGILTI